MELEKPNRTAPTINLAALIDVVFILVIFIVLGANFHRIHALEVSVPEAESSSEAPTESLVITIPADGLIDVQGVKVSFSELRSKLQSKISQFESVLLIADQSTPVQRVVLVLDDAQAAGFTNVSIATQKPEENSP